MDDDYTQEPTPPEDEGYTVEAMSAWLTTSVRDIYRDEGEVSPRLFVATTEGDMLICYPPYVEGERHPLELFGPFIAVASVAMMPKIRLFGFAVEAWVRSMKPDNENLVRGEDGQISLPRGRLQELHDEGDPDVTTGLLTVAWDVADVDHPIVVTSYADQEDWGEAQVAKLRAESDGQYLETGFVPEYVGIEWRRALEFRAGLEPDVLESLDGMSDWPTFIKVACKGGALSGVAILTNNEAWKDAEGAVLIDDAESPVTGDA